MRDTTRRMPDANFLPEIARSLRDFGAPRDAAGEAAHSAIFVPLLDARARAARADVPEALDALRGRALAMRIRAAVEAIASGGESDPARGRARAARATEPLDALDAALAQLDHLAGSARGRPSSSAECEAWIAQLRRVFKSADEACRSVARALRETTPQRPPRRWFGGPG